MRSAHSNLSAKEKLACTERSRSEIVSGSARRRPHRGEQFELSQA